MSDKLAQLCPNFEECNAPLCPLDEETWECGIWYTDETICSLKELGDLSWIKKQRKLAKAGRKGFFTFEMLQGKAAKGIDVDSPSVA